MSAASEVGRAFDDILDYKEEVRVSFEATLLNENWAKGIYALLSRVFQKNTFSKKK